MTAVSPKRSWSISILGELRIFARFHTKVLFAERDCHSFASFKWQVTRAEKEQLRLVT